ncbi:MAG: hypothetical protein ABI051_07605 [Vicinamibacterales bacterium]
MTARHRAARTLAIFIVVTASAILAGATAEFPEATLTSSRIKARLYVPDADAGYYRATRFDWAGVISDLKWRDHSYFGVWFPRHDPKINDAITGPVEEFTKGLGYDEAKPGERFVRIGVGAVVRPQEASYRQFNTYDIADSGTRSMTKGADWIEFTHTLGNTSGYAYAYTKRVRVSGDTLILEHRLKNTGQKPIETSVYQHNFFILDSQPTGPDTVVRFTFAPTAVAALAGLAETRGREVRYLQELGPRQTVLTELKGYGATARDYDIRVENHKTRAGVRQTSDRPLSKLMLWSPRTTVCPEAYIDLAIAPGKETSWRITYEFYEVK